MPRRGNRDGNVRQRSDGSWEASVQISGKRHYARGRTQAEARKQLGGFRDRHATSTLIPHSKLTVEQHLADWLDAYRGEWKPRTTAYYEDNVRLYLVPAFGNVRLQQLDATLVAKQFAEWRAESRVSGGTLLNVYKTLHRALNIALRWGRISRSPAEAVEPPRARRARPQLWSVEETRRFLAVGLEGRWAPVWALLVGPGCRVGEALALEWSDIDLETGVVAIHRSSGRLHGRVIVNAPKTEAAQRELVLPTFALSAIRRWRAAQLEHRLRLGIRWAAGDHVLTRSDGTCMTPDSIRWGLRVTSETAEVGSGRVHDLRHLHASLLLASGHGLPDVAAQLGHASAAVTASIYAHALSASGARSANSVQNAVG